MSHNPEPPSFFKYFCEFCKNKEDGSFWVIPPIRTHIKASKNKNPDLQLANSLKMTITCPNAICGEVNTIYWEPQ
jgi:hypothetical protein